MSLLRKRITQRELDKTLDGVYQEQVRLIEEECSGFEINADASAKRRALCKDKVTGFEYFSKTYFPHIFKREPSQFHHWIWTELPQTLNTGKGQRHAIAAPRGEAKSTILTQLFTLYCVLEELKWYPVIIMDTVEQAQELLAFIKAELVANPRLQTDYPDAVGQGPTWTESEIITSNNRKVLAAGARKRLRGRRHGYHRPDLLLMDDLENDENVKSKEQRDKLDKWILKTALKLGPPDGSMDVLYSGTVLHYDSVLNRYLKKPTWKGHVFKAIIEWPKRMDLWEKWEEVLLNEGEDAAEQFYSQRRLEMDDGAIVSWPDMRPLYMLMLARAEDHEAFDTELQNAPGNSDDAPFKGITFWVQPQHDWVFYGACDPSMGKKNKARDPAALLIGGMSRLTGKLDVVEAKVARMVPDLIIENIILLQKEYRCQVWGIENIAFQEFLRTEIVKRSALRGIPVPARGITPHTDKDLRIESLQPHVANGLIRLHRSQTVLHDQLFYYPEADHDDGPDCLHMLWTLAVSGAAGIPQINSRLGMRQRIGTAPYAR
ncbi:phage terminase large subunit [Shewanella xiamenensis]|uniref:phage terminase large subunit n=1 Tax=Shewanella xiamenensis TaxID=332186 RepID=UPI0009B73978|nr:phage terminase large subunit [Shewanella xiamenensis]